MEEKIIIPNGFKVGNYNDEYTGVTVIINESGAVGGCDCRGGAPGTHETDMLRSEKMMQKINAIALCGGSAYGGGRCGVGNISMPGSELRARGSVHAAADCPDSE